MTDAKAEREIDHARADLDGARPIRECPFCGSPGELENGFVYCTGPECSMHGMEADVWQNRRADTAAALKAKLDAARAGIEGKISDLDSQFKAASFGSFPDSDEFMDRTASKIGALRFALSLLATDAGATAGEDAVPHTRAFVESWEKEHGRSPERAPDAPTRGGERGKH